MKKFLFDTNDFDNTKPEIAQAPVFSEDQLLLAKNQSFAAGKEEGVRETRAAQEEQSAKALARMVTQLDSLIAGEERREVEKCVDAAKLALRVTHKLLPQFASKYALDEIQHVITQSLAARHDEPRIAITVSAASLEHLKGIIDNLALEKGFAGKVILLADDAMGAGDCRVEWADGGTERLYERLFAQIENEFAKAISGLESINKQ